MHPGIDLTSVSDEDLMERIMKVRNMWVNSQHNPQMARSISLILDTLENEYHERQQTARFKEENQKRPPGAIEIGTVENISSDQEQKD